MGFPQIPFEGRVSRRGRIYSVIWCAAWAILWIFAISKGWRPHDPLQWVPHALATVSAVLGLFYAFFTRTRLTQNGVELRTWYGKTRFVPYSDLSVLERENNSVVLTNGTEEVALNAGDLNFPEAQQLLRRV